jgi:hypothetical protein
MLLIYVVDMNFSHLKIKKIKTWTLLLTIKLTFKKMMLLLSYFDGILTTIATKKIRKSGTQRLVQNSFVHEI